MAVSMEEHFKEILTCLLCNEVLTKPRTLPCMHTYCVKCLDTLHKTNEEGDTLKCPECLQVHPVPEDGVEHFKVNLTTNSLVEIFNDLDIKSKPLCNGCLTMHGKQSIAGIKCEECGKKFCENCKRFHNELFQGHCVQDLHDEMEYIKKALGEAKERIVHCSKHQGNILDVYCKVDNSILCSECYNDNHPNHDYVKVQDIAATYRKGLENVLQHGQTRITTLEKNIQTSNQNKHAFEQHAADTTDELTNDMNNIIKAICEKYTDLINTVEESKKQHTKQYDAHIRNLEYEKCAIQSQMRHLQMIHQHGHDTELVSMARDIELKTKEWTVPVQAILDPKCDRFKIKRSEIFKDMVKLGEVDTGNMMASNPQIKLGKLIDPINAKTKTLQGRLGIYQLTAIKGCDKFIAIGQKGIAYVYNDIQDEPCQSFGDSFTNIAVSEDKLYFTKENSADVHVYNHNGGYIQNIKCDLKDPHTMSKKEVQSVAITIGTSGDIWVGKVVKVLVQLPYEKNPRCVQNGIVQNINSQTRKSIDTLQYPHSIAITSTGRVIVADKDAHCVVCMEPSGSEVFRYGAFGSGACQFYNLGNVCADKYDNVLVADYYSSRIHLLTQKGVLVRYISCGMRPKFVTIDNQDNLLILAKNDDEGGTLKTIEYI